MAFFLDAALSYDFEETLENLLKENAKQNKLLGNGNFRKIKRESIDINLSATMPHPKRANAFSYFPISSLFTDSGSWQMDWPHQWTNGRHLVFSTLGKIMGF